jgi:N-acyl-D-amino-acid deacylase
MESDAYATGTVLVALVQAGQLPPDHAAVQRGIRYLLDAQLEDGSWHVVTRAKGFQPYFETGFPHGKDQFISTAASAWSMLALVLVLPETE